MGSGTNGTSMGGGRSGTWSGAMWLAGGLALIALPSLAHAQAAQEVVVVEHEGVEEVVVASPVVVVDGYDEDARDDPRFRFGFTLGGGGLVGQGAGFLAGMQLRFGIQANDYFAVFYQAHGLGGAFVDTNTLGAMGAVFNTLMLELTLLDMLHIGVGPSIDAGAFGFCTEAGCGGASGAFFGLDGRLALTLGSHGPGADSGFSISANVHPTFFEGGYYVLAATLGIGGEWF